MIGMNPDDEMIIDLRNVTLPTIKPDDFSPSEYKIARIFAILCQEHMIGTNPDDCISKLEPEDIDGTIPLIRRTFDKLRNNGIVVFPCISPECIERESLSYIQGYEKRMIIFTHEESVNLSHVIRICAELVSMVTSTNYLCLDNIMKKFGYCHSDSIVKLIDDQLYEVTNNPKIKFLDYNLLFYHSYQKPNYHLNPYRGNCLDVRATISHRLSDMFKFPDSGITVGMYHLIYYMYPSLDILSKYLPDVAKNLDSFNEFIKDDHVDTRKIQDFTKLLGEYLK